MIQGLKLGRKRDPVKDITEWNKLKGIARKGLTCVCVVQYYSSGNIIFSLNDGIVMCTKRDKRPVSHR